MVQHMPAMISVILLAAGESKRMGNLKQLMPFGRSTIMEQPIDALLGSAVDEVIVVVGHRSEEVIKTIGTRPVKLAVNPDYMQGMSTSIVAGIKLIDRKSGAVMLAFGDQPFIDSRTVNRLIKEFRNCDKGIAIPTYQGRRGHPIIFDIKYKKSLLALTGDIGGRQILHDHPGDILEVAVNSEGVTIDIDTIDDYNSYLAKRSKNSG